MSDEPDPDDEITIPRRRQKAPLGDCKTCDQEREEEARRAEILARDIDSMMAFHPPHDASPNCESGGHNHCSCNVCF